MTKRLFILLLIILCTACMKPSTPEAPASSRKQLVTREHLFGVDARGVDKAWVSGFEGVVLHTKDRGKNWAVQKVPIKTDLYDICFVNDLKGWMVGKFGVILHTTDGGQSWHEQKSNNSNRLFDVHFINEQTGWIVGSMGTILHTVDGGKNWVKQGWDEDRYYNGVFFVDENHGGIAGEYSTLYATVNGGKTWIPQTCKEIEPEEPENDFPPPPPNLYGVYFTSADTGWVTGMDGIIIQTRDGGKTWKRLTPKTDFTLYQVMVKDKKGWAIGGKGSYLVSSDSGFSWEPVEDSMKTKFWLRDMVLTDKQSGWIVGALGTIIKTDNSGDDWNGISGIFLK